MTSTGPGVKTVLVLTASAIVVAAIGYAAESGAPGAPPRPSKAAEAVRSAVQPAARAFVADPRAAGLSIGVLSGGEAFTFHFGGLERGEKPPPDDRTVYPIASITKTFTCTLLA